MSNWVKRGLKTGIVTTHYPKKEENALGISPGFPQIRDEKNSEDLISNCPTNAIVEKNDTLLLESSLCIHCYRCIRDVKEPLKLDKGFEWATFKENSTTFSKNLYNSLHICVVDAGDCGACLNETKLLNNPFYNMHRLGFFITPTPRKADILLVVGPVTEHMKIALLKAYEAMPTPKKVMAIGTCSISGGIFKDGFVADSGVSDILPVDITVPGCPPPPLAILHGLLVLSGRKGVKNG